MEPESPGAVCALVDLPQPSSAASKTSFKERGTIHMRGLLFSLFCLLLAACASQGPFPVSDSGARAQAEHLLAPGEKLRITTFGETSLTGEYTLRTAGDLPFPLVGTVPAAGNNPQALGQDLPHTHDRHLSTTVVEAVK